MEIKKAKIFVREMSDEDYEKYIDDFRLIVELKSINSMTARMTIPVNRVKTVSSAVRLFANELENAGFGWIGDFIVNHQLSEPMKPDFYSSEWTTDGGLKLDFSVEFEEDGTSVLLSIDNGKVE